MAIFCTKCGAQMEEKDSFCKACGAPAVKPAAAKKSGGQDAQTHKMIGIAVVAVAALAVIIFVGKGISGMLKGGEKAPDVGGVPTVEMNEDENENKNKNEEDVLKHLEPWMGDWARNYKVYPNQGAGLLTNFEYDGDYYGDIMEWSKGTGIAHVDEDYIDFSDLTKNDKDCFPVSELKYYQTEYGADAFEDEDSGIRFIFFDHFSTGTSTDYGKVLKVQAYVGYEIPDVNYIGDTPVGFTGHYPGPDGWASDNSVSFVPWD